MAECNCSIEYATILNEEVVLVGNYADYQVANEMAVTLFGEGAFAVESRRYVVGVGFKYINGRFYTPDGVTEAEYIPTDEERIRELENKIMVNKDRHDELLIALNGAGINNMSFDPIGAIAMYYANNFYYNYPESERDINKVPDIGNLREVVLGLA